MNIQATLPLTLPSHWSAMATDKKQRVSEAYAFHEFPLGELGLRKPAFVTKSVFSFPELKDNTRMPFINLTLLQVSGYAYASTWIPTTPRPSKTIREYR